MWAGKPKDAAVSSEASPKVVGMSVLSCTGSRRSEFKDQHLKGYCLWDKGLSVLPGPSAADGKYYGCLKNGQEKNQTPSNGCRRLSTERG